MDKKGLFAGILLGLVLIGFVLFVGVDTEESYWVGKESSEKYFAGSHWDELQFHVDVAGRNALYLSLISFGEKGGLGNGDCWNEEVKRMEWWKDEECMFEDYIGLGEEYSLIFEDIFMDQLESQVDYFEYDVNISEFVVESTFIDATFGDEPVLIVEVSGGTLEFIVEDYEVSVPLRFKDDVRFNALEILEVLHSITDHAGCYVSQFAEGDFSSCKEHGWDVGKQGENVVFGVPLAVLDIGSDVVLQFAINLNTLRELVEQGERRGALFGE